MKTIIFDFNNIHTVKEFYAAFQENFNLSTHIANNLDSIWDILTGMLETPIKIEFHNLTMKQLDKFENIISLFEEAESEMENDFDFSYFLFK